MSGFELLGEIQDDADDRGHADRRVHGPGADRGRRGGAAAQGEEHRAERRAVARAPARRDGAVPAPRRGEPPAGQAAHAREPATPRDEALAGKKVLVVDDDVRNIFALSSLLERHGMTVASATTGQEAIDQLETEPDLKIVLMDIMMPEMDGYETMQRIRKNARYPPPADHRADREGDEGRPREMPRGGRLRLHREAGQHRTSCSRSCACGCIPDRLRHAMSEKEAVDILLVDDQPARLLTLRGDPGPARTPARDRGLGRRGAGAAHGARVRRHPARRQHAGDGRLRDRAADPPASALRERRRSSS